MSQVISPKKTVEYLRNQDPYDTSYLSDEEVYGLAQEKYPDIEWPKWKIKADEETIQELNLQNLEREVKRREDLAKVDTSPSVWAEISGFSLIDPERGFIQDDSKYFKDTYNKSAAGMLYQAIEGTQKYDVGDYEPDLIGEIGQFFLGHLSPLDAATFFGTGFGAGKVTAFVGKKYLADLGVKGLTTGLVKRFPKAPFIRDAVIKGSIQGGLGLGGYGAANGTLAEWATQSSQINDPDHPRDKFDIQQIMYSGASHGLESAALGAVSSGLVKGTLGTKYGFAKLQGKDKTFMDKAAMVYGNPASQVFAEANAFTAGEFAFGDEELTFENYLRGLARNGSIMTGLKVFSPSTWSRQSEDIRRLIGQTREFQKAGEKSGAFEKVLDNVQKDLKKNPNNTNLFQEELLLEEISSQKLELIEKLGGQEKLSKVNKELARIAETLDPGEAQKIINKSVDKGFKSLSKEEKAILKDVDYWLNNSNMHNNVMLQIHQDLWKNPKSYIELLNKEAEKRGEPPLDVAAETRAIKNLENSIDEMIQFSDYTNSIVSGHTPTSYPKGAKFNFWKELVENEIIGKKVKEPVVKDEVPVKEIIEKKPTKPQKEQINDFVDKLAVELNKTPDQIRAIKEYQTGILDPNQKPYLSLERLEKAYENALALKPDTPQSALKRVMVEAKAEASGNKNLDRKVEGKKTIREYLDESGLDKENKEMALVGFNEFMPLRKSSNAPINYKELIDFFKFAQDNRKNVNTLNSEVTNAYIKEKNYNKAQRNKLNNTLSAFYGTGQEAKVERLKTGFAYSYMGTKETTPSISLMGESRVTGPAKIEKIGVAEPREYIKVQKVKSDLVSKGETLTGSAKKRKITPETYDTATEMLYEFGSRGEDTLNRLMIENIDWNNGIIKKWSTGWGHKGARGDRINVPLKEVIPDLWDKLVKVKGDRTEGQLFKTIAGEVLEGKDINKLNKEYLPKDIVLTGEKGTIQIVDYRRMAETDASKTGRADIITFVDDLLVGHQQLTREIYNIKDIPELWKEFREFRKSEVLTPSKTASDAFDRLRNAGSLGTKDFFRQETSNYTRKQKLQDAIVVGAEVLNQGFKTFKNFSGEMIKRVGDSIKPYLTKLYKQAKDYIKEPKIGLGIKVIKDKFKSKKIKIKGADIDTALKSTRISFNESMKALDLQKNIKAKSKMAEYIGRLGDIENIESFKKALFKGKKYEGFMDDLAKFKSAMKELDIGKLSNVSKKVKWFSTYKDVERMRIRPEVNITEAQLSIDMKRLGVGSGNIWDANLKQLNRYAELLKTIEYPDTRGAEWLNQATIENNLNKKLAAEAPVWTQAKGRLLPFGHFLESIGLDKLAGKMRDHIHRELNHIGDGLDTFERDAFKIISGRIGKITGTSGRWERVKDRLWTLDKDRYNEALTEGTVSRGEKNFIKKAVDENWKPRTNTKEGKLAARYKEFTKYYVKAFKDALKQVMSEAEYEKFTKGDNIKWIEDGFYVSRILTKAFKKKYNLHSKHIEEWVNDESVKYAKELAEGKYKTKDVSNKQINEFLEVAEGEIRAGVYDMMNLSTTKVSSRFLKRRHLKLPERIGGIKVYETSYENTMKVYANSMSKFIANIEIFPEYVSMKGFDFSGVKSEIQQVKQSHGKWGNFIIDGLERQIGKGKGSPFDVGQKLMQTFANTLAKTGLSFPTSGLKNLYLGTVQTSLAFETRDMSEGFLKVLSAENRKSVGRTGALKIGLAHLDAGWMDRALDASIFKVGLMKPTESFNRYLSVLTSRVEQGRLANIIRNKSTKVFNPKKYKKAMLRYENFYKLNKEDIALLEKYGMEGIDGHKFNTPYERAVENRKIKNVYQKMDSMAHIKTQGASISLFMPEWADKSFIRPATLYKRMAYAATVNAYDNGKLAFKTGDLMRLASYVFGSYLSGKNLIAVNDMLFGKKPPGENSPWWRQLMTILWRGEFGGILSSFLSPDGLKSGFSDIVIPVIGENANLGANKLLQAVNKETTVDYAVKDYMKRTLSLYNGLDKMYEKRSNPYSVKTIRHNKLHREYEKKYSGNKEPNWKQYTRDPYYRRLEDTFNKGTEKEFTKQYIITILTKASAMNSEGYSPDNPIRNFDEAMLQAIKDVDRQITTFNPNKGTLDKEDVGLKRSIDFLTWVKDGMGNEVVLEILKNEQEFKDKKEKYMDALPYNLRQADLNHYIKKYFKPKKKKKIKKRTSLY